MHEWSLILALVREAERQGRNAGATSVTCVRVTASEDMRLVPELLQRAFEVARKGTMMEGARLEIETDPAPAGGGFLLRGLSVRCPEVPRDV